MTESPQGKFDYEVPAVSYEPILNDEGRVVGQQVQPPFELTRDHLTTLRHFAALIEHRTGTKVRVSPSDTALAEEELPPEGDQPAFEYFDVLTAHTTGGPATYGATWAWMSGFETGIHELVWKAQKENSGA